jgi:hypothetical protein
MSAQPRPARPEFQTDLASPPVPRRPRFKTWHALAALLVAAFALVAAQASAQNYAIDWYKIAAGGGTSSNGQYLISGTIGQHDAGVTMTGGSYALTGGFWTFGAVQTPGAPVLNITQNGPNNVLVWWLGNATTFKLQTNATLSSATWTAYTGAINSSGGTNSVALSAPRGNLFFRLAFP